MKKVFKNSLILVVFLFFTITCKGQDLRCHVIDAQTGENISFANAIYPNTQLRAYSDSLGFFIIKKKVGKKPNSCKDWL